MDNQAMERAAWLTANRAAINRRLRRLVDERTGILFFEPAELHIVVVDKIDSQLRLVLADPASDLVQSRLDLNDPLYLVSPYSQAVMLGLIWTCEPKRIYVIGLGGGRIPMVLYHYAPGVVIECTEIDALIVKVAARYFGLAWDDRLSAIIGDGRDYLAAQPDHVRYDMILMDAFPAHGDGPFHLATQEFYRLCQAHLSEGGVMIANLLHHDSLYLEKLKTFQAIFETTYVWSAGQSNTVVFGVGSEAFSGPELIERALAIQDHYQFSFPLVERAAEVTLGTELSRHLPALADVGVLSDARLRS